MLAQPVVQPHCHPIVVAVHGRGVALEELLGRSVPSFLIGKGLKDQAPVERDAFGFQCFLVALEASVFRRGGDGGVAERPPCTSSGTTARAPGSAEKQLTRTKSDSRSGAGRSVARWNQVE